VNKEDKGKEIAGIFDECLDKLLKGETVDACLKSYPQFASELRPLLEVALATHQSVDIKPGPEFKARARYQLNTVLDEMEKQQSRRSWLGWLRLAQVTVSLSLALVISGGGMVVVAGNSMPGEFLYSVKLTSEQVRLSFSLTTESKAEQYIRMADERIEEIIYLVPNGNSSEITETSQRLEQHLDAIVDLVAPEDYDKTNTIMSPSLGLPEDDLAGSQNPPDTEKVFAPADGIEDDRVSAETSNLLIILFSDAQNNTAALAQAMEIAPGAVQAALAQAISTSIAGYQNAIDATRQWQS